MTVTGFALPGEESARESVERTFAKSLAQVDACLALGVKLLQRTSSFVVTRKRTEKVGLVVMGLYMKALKTVRAIRIVASPDLVEDGFVLCRSLLETTVAILYVLQKDSPRRADEYIAHTLGSGVSLEETFKRVGLNRLYQTLYRRLSVHPHAADLESHAEPSEQGGLQLKAGTSGLREMNFLLDSTRLLFCAVMQRVSQEMDMGYQAEIEALKPRAGMPTRMLSWAWKKRMQARSRAVP
jgi:hypothetical protein